MIQEEPHLSVLSFLTATLGDMPLVSTVTGTASKLRLTYRDPSKILFAMQAIRSSKKLPLKSLTLLSSSAADLGWRINNLQTELKELGDFNKVIRTLYEAIDIVNHIQDGELSYPGETSSDAGMKIEFRFESEFWRFPLYSTDSPSNFQLCFVQLPSKGRRCPEGHVVRHPARSVMCDRRGKRMWKGAVRSIYFLQHNLIVSSYAQSSTVKLLSRLYDASQGEILIDDVPVSSFKAKELRKAQAILYQDFIKYPITVRSVRIRMSVDLRLTRSTDP